MPIEDCVAHAIDPSLSEGEVPVLKAKAQPQHASGKTHRTGEAVLTEAPLLLAPNKLEKPFGRVHALYDLEPAARRTLLTELFAPAVLLPTADAQGEKGQLDGRRDLPDDCLAGSDLEGSCGSRQRWLGWLAATWENFQC